jgi:ABC-type multidrug transport system fused ATPase/permease subunit
MYVMQLSFDFSFCITEIVEVENLVSFLFLLLEHFENCRTWKHQHFKMTSVERINEYIALAKEPLKTGVIEPLHSWPPNGEIEFRNVSFSYDPSLPSVLKDVSFKIKAREKVGIVGRTGAGKSTIFETLFRMAEPCGDIIIDGINTKHISLHNLRSSIAIIPVSDFILSTPVK